MHSWSWDSHEDLNSNGNCIVYIVRVCNDFNDTSFPTRAVISSRNASEFGAQWPLPRITTSLIISFIQKWLSAVTTWRPDRATRIMTASSEECRVTDVVLSPRARHLSALQISHGEFWVMIKMIISSYSLSRFLYQPSTLSSRCCRLFTTESFDGY